MKTITTKCTTKDQLGGGEANALPGKQYGFYQPIAHGGKILSGFCSKRDMSPTAQLYFLDQSPLQSGTHIYEVPWLVEPSGVTEHVWATKQLTQTSDS